MLAVSDFQIKQQDGESIIGALIRAKQTMMNDFGFAPSEVHVSRDTFQRILEEARNLFGDDMRPDSRRVRQIAQSGQIRIHGMKVIRVEPIARRQLRGDEFIRQRRGGRFGQWNPY